MLDLTWISWILPHFGAGFDLDLWDFPYFRAGSTPFSLLLLPHQFHPSPPERLELNWELAGWTWDGQR